MAGIDWATDDGPGGWRIWGGRPWSVRLDDPTPGLSPLASSPPVRLLAILGASVAGEPDAGIVPVEVVVHEVAQGDVVTSYRVVVGGEVAIRAAWSAAPGVDGVDLEIEVGTRTVGLVRRLNLVLGSQWPASSRVESLPVPGPEAAGSVLLPPAARSRITRAAFPDVPGWSYVEMASPFGLLDGPVDSQAAGTRYRYFGNDLERGVILRARIRGVWVPGVASAELAMRLWEQFADSPLLP